MYLLPLIVLILQTVWCSAEDETQVLIKDTPRKGDWICTRAGINFTEFLHETHCYVDKTLLLEKLFANETISNVLISIPPRWGKTLVLKQAEFFLALEVDATHSPISPQQTASHQFFTEGKISASGNYTEFKFAKPPLISKRSEFISKHLAQYQVVYLNFADFGPAKNYPKFYGNFKEAIGKIFENRLYVKHVFVKNLTDQLSASGNNEVETKLIQGLMDNLKQQFDAYLNREKATDEQWADSIVYFSKIIHQYFGKKVILLIDNIDYIVGMMSEMAPLGRSRSAQFLLNFFNKTVNEGCLYKIVATTTLPLIMNRITNNTAKDFVYLGNIGNELKPFIGFTESEFKQLSEPLKLESNLTDAAVQRYDGYFENTIYNPISVSHFLNKQQVDNYWVRENSAHVNELNIFPDSHLHEALKKLMSGLHYPYEAKRKLPIAFGYDKTAPPVSSLWIGEGASDPSITVANTELEEDFLLYLLAKGIATTYLEKKTVHVRIANEENKAVIRRRFPEL